jgi:glycosyltransferase involved in cell wall biosynthesis
LSVSEFKPDHGQPLSDPLLRIAMLVPHDPDDDPRIRWVASTCAEVARTQIIGAVWDNRRPAVEYDGIVSTERRNIYEISSTGAQATAMVLAGGGLLGGAGRYLRREGRRPDGFLRLIDHHIGAGARFLSAASFGNVLVDTLTRAGCALSVPPRVVICHDIYALLAAPALKRRFNCAVIYDSHEFWPEADLLARGWEIGVLTRLERRAIRHADAVVTVSPPLADHLRELYELDHVLSVPNAELLDDALVPSSPRPRDEPVRFLFQGQVAPGRGIEPLMKTWADIGAASAVLELRCPENTYLSQLRERFAAPIASGTIALQQPVPEAELVQAAAASDVGVIPYVGPSLNHLYACPNKLSQYMHAGLAILANDLVFVGDVVKRYDCGLVYRAEEPDSFGAAVRALVDDRELLERFKRNAYAAFASEFNWKVQAAPYKELLQSAFVGDVG